MAYCRKCGAELPENSKFCVNCGVVVEETDGANSKSGGEEKKGLVIASFILGLGAVSFGLVGMLGWWLISLVPLAAGIVGIVLAVRAHKGGNDSGLRTAGLILSIIGVVLAAVGVAAFVSCNMLVDQTAKQIGKATEGIMSNAAEEYEKDMEKVMDDYANAVDDYMNQVEDSVDDYMDHVEKWTEQFGEIFQ